MSRIKTCCLSGCGLEAVKCKIDGVTTSCHHECTIARGDKFQGNILKCKAYFSVTAVTAKNHYFLRAIIFSFF